MRRGGQQGERIRAAAPQLVDAGDQERDREGVDRDGTRKPRSAAARATQLLDDRCGEDATGGKGCGNNAAEEADRQGEQRGCGDARVGVPEPSTMPVMSALIA